MREYAWTEKAIVKSAFAGINALSLHQAKIPLINGSYIIPPYVSRNNQYYKLIKQNRTAPYKKIIHIMKKSMDKYAFVPTPDVPDRIKEIIDEQTKDYDSAVQPGSSMYEELQNLAFMLADEAQALGLDEPEKVLDIKFSSKDVPINQLLEDIVLEASNNDSGNYLAKLYIEQLKKEKIKEAKHLINQFAYKFDELPNVEKSMYYSYAILLSYAQKSGQTPLLYEFVHALMQYKFDTVNKSQVEKQINILYKAINNAYKLMTNGYFVHNPARRFTWEPVFYSRLLIISTVLGKVLARFAFPNGVNETANPNFSCYKRFENIKFDNMAGFSSEVAKNLDNFFEESAKPFVIKIDGRYKEIDELESLYCQNDFEMMVNTLDIINGAGTMLSFDYGTHPKQIEGSSERFQFPLLDMSSKMEQSFMAKIMAGSFMSLGDLETTIETLRTKNNFLKIFKNNKLVSTFAFTYSAKLAPQQRGEINQLYIGRVHKSTETKNINKVNSKYSEVMDNILVKADELYEKAVESTKDNANVFIKTFNEQMTIIPMAQAYAEFEKPEICDINMLYFKNLNIFETSDGLYSRKIDDELLYDKYLYDHGHIHVNYSKILANLQYMMLAKKYKLKNVYINQKKQQNVVNKERLLSLNMSTSLQPMFHDYNSRFINEKRNISYTDKLSFLKKITKQRVKEDIGEWNMMQKAVLQSAAKILIEALQKQRKVWRILCENLTGQRFTEDTLQEIVQQIINNNVARTTSEILSEFINVLTIGEYIKENVYDEDVEFKVFDELNIESQNKIEKKKFIETLLKSSQKNENFPLIVMINRNGKQIVATALNSKRSSTDAAGMSDYGFDIITLNQSVTDIGMMSYSISARTDVFSFYTNMNDNNLSPTYLYNVDHFAETTIDNYIKIITNLIGKNKFELTINRGVFLKIGVKNSRNNNLSFAYIMPEASARKIYDDMLAEDYGQRSLTLSRPLKEEELQPVPIIDMTLHFDGSIVPSKQLYKVEIMEIVFHIDVIDEYVKSLVFKTKQKELDATDVAKTLYNHKNFGNIAFKKYFKSIWANNE